MNLLTITGGAGQNTHIYSLDNALISRIKSSILCLTGEHISATAIVWNFVGDKVLILTNYHTWDNKEFEKVFPPLLKKSKKRKKRKVTDEDEDDSIEMTLSNDFISKNFHLSSEMFSHYDVDEDYAVLQLPIDGFSMQRIPINLEVGVCLKIHAFGYVGHTGKLNITPGEVSSIIVEGFTMSLLSAPGYSGAAILSDGAGLAVGYMGGNLNASKDKNSQHQSYAFRFDAVMMATQRDVTPTSSPSVKGVKS